MRHAAAASLRGLAKSVGRLRMTPRFMRALEEHAGHSRLASLMLLQSRQRTAWFKGMVDFFMSAVIVCGPVAWKPSGGGELRFLTRRWQAEASVNNASGVSLTFHQNLWCIHTLAGRWNRDESASSIQWELLPAQYRHGLDVADAAYGEVAGTERYSGER